MSSRASKRVLWHRSGSSRPVSFQAWAGGSALVALLALTAGTTGRADSPLPGCGPLPVAASCSDLAAKADNGLVLSVARLDADRLVAVGDRGHVLMSDDRGESWRQIITAFRRPLTAVTVDASGRPFAVGHDAAILTQESAPGDPGILWRARAVDPDAQAPLLAIGTVGRRLVAVGAYGLYQDSDDGGVTWRRRDVDADEPHFYAIAEAGDGNAYLAGEFGTVLRSSDGGDSWTRLDFPYDGTLFGVLPVSNGRLLAFGLRGNLFLSEDGGESWVSRPTGTTASLLGGLELPGDGAAPRVLLHGLSGTILLSEDGGRSFSDHSRSDRLGIADAVDLGDGRLVTVGEGGARVLAIPGLDG